MIVTTHLMEEAEGCDQLLLLDRGQLVANGTPQELQSSVAGQRLTVRTRNNAKFRPQLEALLHADAQATGDRLCFRLHEAAGALQQVMSEMADAVLSAEVAQPTLEDVFLEKTGRVLSDDTGDLKS